MLVIFVLSSIPGDRFPEMQFRLADKMAHFLIFGILAVLLARSIRNTITPFWKNRYIQWSILIAIIYGFIDEWHQMYSPGRYASSSDLIADVLGILCFVSIYFWWVNKRNKNMMGKVRK